MTDERSAPERKRMTRRGVLALAGTSVLAGCGGLGEFGGETEPTIRAHELPDIDSEEYPEPVVPESVPVGIAGNHFDSARNRVTTLLADLPIPLGPEDIPNGYIRKRLSDAATNATTGLNGARDASTELEALASLQRARADARYAAAGWAVAARGLTAEPIQREYERVVSDARSVQNDHEYVGTDPVRAALVHSRIEDMLHRVLDSRALSVEENSLLHVAEWGETAESAQVHLDDARHLDEQFTASLPADAGSVEATLTDAADVLFSDIQSRRSGLPPEPTADEWGVPEFAIGDLRREADIRETHTEDADRPASAVVDANRQLTRFHALNRLRERIDDGELSRPQSAEAVREIRSEAFDALEAALDESSAPELTRTALTNAAWRVASADWELSRYEGEINVSRLDRNVADYIVATAIGRVAPNVSGRAVETLESA